MGIKIKNKKPTLNEFSSKDLIVNPQENKLFFKGKDKVVEVGSGLPGQWIKRDNNNIFYRSGSAQVLDDGTNNYIIELEAASGGPRINFGDHDSNNDAFMVLGAFDNINQINTKGRDFHLYGTNTTTGFYFDESAGRVGIGTTTPDEALEVVGSVYVNAENHGFIIDAGNNQRIGLMKYSGHEAYIARTSAQDFGIVRVGGSDINSGSTINFDIYVQSDGKVGVGTNDPDELFHVEGSVDDDDVAILIQNTSDDESASTPPRVALLLDAASNNAYFRYFGAPDDAASGHQIDIGSTAGNSFITFSPSSGSAGESMRITSAGRVGIGTTTPSGSLHINETTGASAGANGQGSLVLSHDNIGGASSIVFVSRVNSNSDHAYIQYEEDASDFGSTSENGLLTIGIENDSSSTNEDAIKFRLNASDSMVIRGDGDVGIGTTDPGHKLHVNAAVNDYALQVENVGNSSKGIRIKIGPSSGNADGNEQEGNNNHFIRFTDHEGGNLGTIEAEEGTSVYFNEASDRRLKQNIRPIQNVGIEDLLKIQVREFTWKKDETNKKQHGFIAQEIEKIYPYAVKGEANEDPHLEPMALVKSNFIPLIVKSIQDQQTQIEELKKRIEKLENKIK